MALSMLSTMDANAFTAAVAAEDAHAIARTPGVGLKKAQKIILELKDKIERGGTVGADIEDTPQQFSGGEALDALLVLGYQRAEALSALKGIDPKLSLEARIGEALKRLSRI